MRPFATLKVLSALLLTVLYCCACGSADKAALPEAVPEAATAAPNWPDGLPGDGRQPWEDGAVSRESSALDAQSEFTAGVERFGEGGTVMDIGEVSRLSSGDSGSADLSYAQYRIPLGSAQPGALAFDVNLLARSDGSPSQYYVGLSSYDNGRWEWHGPYSEHHVRLVASDQPGPDVFAGDDYTSEFDNLFVNLLVHGGSSIDILGITHDALDSLNSDAPPVPEGLSASPVAGGLALQWNDVIAGDLAGYRIYHSASSFNSPAASGVRSASYIEGSNRHILGGLKGLSFVRIAAMDISGNESALSTAVSASALPGTSPELSVEISLPSVPLNALATLSVSGELTDLQFDYDLDGDGIFELTGQPAGEQSVDTGSPGLLRPRVRAADNLGERQALGGVSIFVTSNSRPVATSTATPQSGSAPLLVDFDGTDSTDFDGTITGGGWDFDGDGIYDAYDESSTDQLTAQFLYEASGFYNARLRVIDDQGAWDVDTIGIFVDGGGSQDLAPVASLVADPGFMILGSSATSIPVKLDASGSFDPEAGVLEYAWDVDGNGSFAGFGSEDTATFSSFTQGLQHAGVRVRDEAGNISQATVTYAVYQFNSQLIETGVEIDNSTSIASVESILGSTRIGIAYYDSADDFLRFAYSTDQNGYSWVDSYIVDPLGGEWMELMQGDSRFSLVWYRDGDLFFAESSDEGRSFGAPELVDGSPDDAGLYVASTKSPGASGNAFAYYNASAGDLYFTKEKSGGGFETPVNVDGTGTTGLYPDLLYSSGRMNIAYYRQDTGNLMFAQSTDSSGLSWNVPVIADDSVDDVGKHPSLIRSGNLFYIAYVGPGNDVWFVASSDSNGSSWETPLYLGNVTAKTCELMIVNGRFLIIIGDDFFGRGEFIQSTDSSGIEWGSWEYYDYGDTTAHMSATTLANGMPGLAYWDEDDELYFNAPRFD
jgi:PKD repeat protein